MAKQVRPWLTKPDTNHEPRVRAPDEASTSGFHQGQRNAYSSTEGRIYGCNLHLPSQYERDCLATRGASIYGLYSVVQPCTQSMIALSVIPAWVLGPGNMLPAWEGKRMIAFSLSNLMLVDTI